MEVKTITKDNFEAEVLKADKPVLVDFWAIPTLLVFKNGEVAGQQVGAVPKEAILAMIK